MIMTQTDSIHGISLAETAVVIAVSGIILATAALAARPATVSVQKELTQSRMEKVSGALSLYAMRHNRLPCPASANPSAEPFGAEIGSGAGGNAYNTSCTGDDAEGIIPFRALGLNEGDIRDGYGNLMTYRVSPVFAVSSADLPNAELNTVHERCRTSEWMEDSTVAGGPNVFQANASHASGSSPVLYDADAGLKLTMSHLTKDPNKTGYGDIGWYDIEDHGVGLGNADRPHANKIGGGFTLLMEYDEYHSGLELIVGEMANNLQSQTVGIDFHIWPPGTENDPTAYIHKEIGVDASNLVDDKFVTFEFDTFGLGFDEFKKIEVFTSNDVGTLPRASMTINTLLGIGGSSGVIANKNPAKARFCCPTAGSLGYTPSSDLVLEDGNGDAIWPFARDASGSQYDDVNTTATGTIDGNSFAPAYVLISHGPNGVGAFLANGSDQRLGDGGELSAVVGDDEQENGDGDNTFIISAVNSSEGSNHFDDIIMWRTQDQVYAHFGNDSCAQPYTVLGSALSQ